MSETHLLLFLIRRFYGGKRITARSENGLIKQICAFSDKEKRRIRFFCTCLFLNKIVKQNSKIIHAYTTALEKKQNRARVALRNKYVRLGIVKRNDGTHLHHKDGNVFNTTSSNIQVLRGKTHKRFHRHHEADANCVAFLKQLKSSLQSMKQNDLTRTLLKRLI